MDLVIPNKNLTISEGAVTPLGPRRPMWLWTQVDSFADKYKIPIDIEIEKLDKEKLNKLLFGSGKDDEVKIAYQFNQNSSLTYSHKFIGVLPSIQHQFENTNSNLVRQNIENFMSVKTCPKCKGGRLKEENLSVLIHGNSIQNMVSMDISEAVNYFS